MEPLGSALPYREIVSEELFNVDNILMDESRIMLFKTNLKNYKSTHWYSDHASGGVTLTRRLFLSLIIDRVNMGFSGFSPRSGSDAARDHIHLWKAISSSYARYMSWNKDLILWNANALRYWRGILHVLTMCIPWFLATSRHKLFCISRRGA
ncbi:uncharacterized protein HD556DRAFT_269504 [Suillus plorans]|uniref:Uncharacterized protein n=1 Tax=Suillus plorans TaxID=116603 RepID=A0A9P7DKG0_9AGAM|nr:uncharacterized protein HD556DRAFT_269504 [Suillus plorans]KAG1797039.1 hypothetical protein HD556DRAFT_269504 [Suillus plorans]KAG1829374.1 hypothetical protein EV424DRAFT_450586 [Suillus variegatus]